MFLVDNNIYWEEYCVLKSFCIKTNNNKVVDYLLKEFNNIDLETIYISKVKFKLYTNVIIHYKGNDIDSFYNIFSYIISSAIISFYENTIIKQMINHNYFYFSEIEQRKIFDIACEYLSDSDLEEICIRKDSIMLSCLEYFSNNKSVILDGFINFRINSYMKIIDYIIDLSVNKFVIDKEYQEFIDLLKCYINSKKYGTNLVHLIYQNHDSILLDEYKKTIDRNPNVLNYKYLSDISFSSNDYTLNSLLTLLPEKIVIHLIDNDEDEFIETLKLIFDSRIYICNDCNICKLYRLQQIHK